MTIAPTSPTKVETSAAVDGPTQVKAFKVFFAMASAELEESSKEAINTWFEEFGSKAQILKITGYAQATPKGASLDPALSARRARAVKNFFIELGYTGKFRTSGAGRTTLNKAESRYVEVVTP
jgi:outer membrane protein OmpA-like peptidoglycan-associated protein